MSPFLYRKPDILDHKNIGSGHVVIEASAGTGKTYTLEHLVVDLLLKDPACSIENILVVTFTRRATAELRSRVRTILGRVLSAYEQHEAPCSADAPHWAIGPVEAARLREAVLSFDQAEIFTIHSFCQKLLTENAFQNHQLFDLKLVDETALFAECYEDILRTKISTDPALKGWFDAWMDPRVSGSVEALGESLASVYASTGKLVRSARFPHAFPTPKSLLEDVEADPKSTAKKPGWQTDILTHLLASVCDELDKRKQSEGLYCYNDMLSMVAQSLAAEDTESALLTSLKRQYRYALIDEFQDTDQIQWDIFRRIFDDSDPQRRLFLIGDPKQAIYKFRGADVWTYLRAVNAISPSREDRVILDTNYRSTPKLVEAYNAIFRQNPNSLDDSFFTNSEINYESEVRPHLSTDISTNHKQTGEVSRAAISAMRIEVKTGKKGTKKDFDPRWVDWMLSEIESILWGAGRFNILREVKKDKTEVWSPVKPSDIFILTNTNRESRDLGRQLQARGIPYSFYRQGGLFQSAEALDILAVLQALARPDKRDKRRAAYRSPFFAVPIGELAAFDEGEAGEPAYKLLRQWREIGEDRAFTRLFRKIMDDSGILLREILLGHGERGLTNYRHIFEILGAQASSADQNLDELIRWLRRKIDSSDGEDDQDLQRLETDRPAVQVMTMHKSKGLEAEVVFIYGGFNPNYQGVKTFLDSDNPSDQASERVTVLSQSSAYLGGNNEPQKKRHLQQSQWDSQRVMYVAITRAKSHLYLCYAAPDAQKTTYGRQSRHEALARSLDRLYADRDALKAAGLIEFIDIGEPGSHPHSSASKPVDAGAWKTALDALDTAPPHWSGLRNPPRIMTAFSSVKKHEPPGEITNADELDEPTLEPPVDPRFGADFAIHRGGAKFGSFLHNILEDLSDYSSALACANAAQWLARDEVKRVFDHRCKSDGIEAKFQPYSARILFDTLRTPLDLDGGAQRVCVAEIPMPKIAKEIDFHFPMPQHDIDFGPWPEDPPRIARGWIKGSIDLTFEHGSKIYIADWKSNHFNDFRPSALARELDKSYALQARIYTLAIVRMLGIGNERAYDARFGGCAYLMLRAMRPDAPAGHGVAICRPTWSELEEWDRGLLDNSDQWNAPRPVFSAR